MPDYIYSFNIDEFTIQKLKRFNEGEWNEIISRILNNKSVSFNVSFSKVDSETRLCELYNVLQTKSIDTFPFQSALVTKLQEYYGRRPLVDDIYTLIQVIDHVRPVAFFTHLQLLAVSPENQRMINVEAPSGLSIHFYLINSIMKFDHSEALYAYLLSLHKKTKRLEAYQITLRYLYLRDKQVLFDEYLNTIFPNLEKEGERTIVLKTFEEYIYYKKDCSLLFFWLFENRKLLPKLNSKFFIQIVEYLLNKFDSGDLSNARLHLQTKAFLFAISGKDVPSQLFDKLVKQDMKQKRKFFDFLGSKMKYTGLDRDDDGNYYIPFLNPKLVYDRDFCPELEAFESAQNRSRNESLQSQLQIIQDEI